MIKICQNAYLLYIQELAEKRTQELEAKGATIRVQEQETKQAKLKEIDNDLAMIKSVIKIAENSIKDSNSHLESLLTKGTIKRDAIAKAHQKISMGVKKEE